MSNDHHEPKCETCKRFDADCTCTWPQPMPPPFEADDEAREVPTDA